MTSLYKDSAQSGKTSLLLVYLVFVLAILGARWFADPVKPYRMPYILAEVIEKTVHFGNGMALDYLINRYIVLNCTLKRI